MLSEACCSSDEPEECEENSPLPFPERIIDCAQASLAQAYLDARNSEFNPDAKLEGDKAMVAIQEADWFIASVHAATAWTNGKRKEEWLYFLQSINRLAQLRGVYCTLEINREDEQIPLDNVCACDTLSMCPSEPT